LRKGYNLRVLKNMMLKKTLEPKREEIIGEWRIKHNEELNELLCLPNTASRVSKSRRMERQGHVGDERCTQGFDEET
jgi:hypothetical protein